MFSPQERALRKLVRDYQSLNASCLDELDTPPSPLEFSKFVAANRPFVVRGGGRGIPALEKWTDEYLVEKLAEKEVQVSVSRGDADSVVTDDNGEEVFVEPASVPMTLKAFFKHLEEEEEEDEDKTGEEKPVFYLQSQDGNMGKEFEALREDVGAEGPSWAREVFGEAPDAVNLWVGGGKSRTAMHKDPYENVYMVVRGTKTFTLLPPTEFYCLHEQEYPHATYSFSPPSSLSITRTTPEMRIPWTPVDPTNPDLDAHPRLKLARPLTVTLEKGDMLYLPALWFHHVTQTTSPFSSSPSSCPSSPPSSSSAQGIKSMLSVNYWYDMRMEGSFYATMQYLRRQVLALDGREDPREEDSEEE
ncbi:hypothetical protein JCM8547_004904 [Rhodosporidiobolus lusitaniae]